MSKVLKEVFLQGSYAQHTAIRPCEGTDFDVDVVLAMDATDKEWSFLGSKRSPAKVLDWVADRLRNTPNYKDKVRRRTRCVRIDFAGDFRVDVLPAHTPTDASEGLEVPDRENAVWVASHPKKYLEWCSQRNATSNGRFVRVTKFLKWWRDNKVPKSARPKSIILQTMIGDRMPTGVCTDAEALVRVLEAMAPGFARRLFWSTPEVSNPSRPSENLARSWSSDDAAAFGEHLRRAGERAKNALDEVREAKAAELWQQIFGDRFPLSV